MSPLCRSRCHLFAAQPRLIALSWTFLRSGPAWSGPRGARSQPPAREQQSMKAEQGDGGSSMINLSVQQVLSLWAHGTVLRSLTEMWYWVFLWALFSSLFVHGAAGVLMFVMLQRHKHGRLISVILVSVGFLASVTGAMITSIPKGQFIPLKKKCSAQEDYGEERVDLRKRFPVRRYSNELIVNIRTTGAAVAGIYRVAGKNMAPLEALVFGVGQTVLTIIISFSRILATL